MAIKFQYNKTSLGELGKQLKMRQKALPTIKSKESALRSEVKKAKDTAQDFRRQLDALTAQYDYMVSLWGEFDADLLRIADVDLAEQKIAGVRTPVLQDIRFEEKDYDLFSAPVWFADGVDILKRAIRKIKRFMEDEENLSKSAQKIVKTKQQQAGEGAML